MNNHRTLVNLISLVAILASFLFCSAAFAESEGPCARQTNIAASNKLNKLGHREYGRSNFKGAATYYSKAIGLNPKLTLAYACRGDCYHDIGDCAKALCDYNRALELEPHDSFVLGCRGETKGKLRDNRGALADFDAAIKMGPTYFFMYSGRATLRFELKDYAGAIADCDKGLQKCPMASNLYLCRGAAYEALAKLTEARSDYSKAIELHPNDLYAYEKRSFINFKMGNLPDGICDFIHSRGNDFPPLPALLLFVLCIEVIQFTPSVIEVKSCMR